MPFDPVSYALLKKTIRKTKANLEDLRTDLDTHKTSKTDHVPSGKYICSTSRSDQKPSWNDIPDKPSAFPPEAHTHSRSEITDFWSSPFWNNIPDKPDKYPPEAHGSSHNIGASDEIPDLATLRNDFDSHKASKTDHVPSGKYICSTSRSDQLPSWNDIPDKPSEFPPEPHTHSRSDITDLWSSPFWDNIPDKPSAFPPEAHGSSHNIGASDEIPDLKALRSDFDAHKVSTTDHVPSGMYICATSRSDQLPSWNDIPDKPSEFPPEPHTHTRGEITDFWSSPFWENIPDKPSAFPPEAHGSSHNIGGSDEIPDLATLRSDFDSHKVSKTDHVPSGKYVCATSRSDQLPSWNDIPDKPSAFPPEAHTHSRSDITDLWSAPFWENIPDKPDKYPPEAHTHTRSEITDFWSTPFWDKIPDKPSAFPPEPHTHSRSDITDFWSSPFWDNIPDKPSTFPPSAHASSHKPGGSDALFPADFHINPASDNTYDLGTTSLRWRNIRAVNIYASNIVQVGDLVFKNGWRISEHEKYGLVLVSPDGKMYKIQLVEVNNDEENKA